MKIEQTSAPRNAEINFLTQKINEETMDYGTATNFAFFIRDEQGDIIAGVNGSLIFGSIYTDQLRVHPDHRKKGLVHQLMEAVHDYGRKSYQVAI
jgi:GNAT superfamily N-acetyltransferase